VLGFSSIGQWVPAETVFDCLKRTSGNQSPDDVIMALHRCLEQMCSIIDIGQMEICALADEFFNRTIIAAQERGVL
jgi:hypothetical protein